MNFSEALDIIKQGRLVARKGWNGKGMFIFIGFASVEVYRKEGNGVIDIIDAKEWFNSNYSGPTLCLKTAQNTIVVGWLASQTDMMSTDWIEIDEPAKPGL